MMLNTNHTAGRIVRLLLMALVGINVSCNRNGKSADVDPNRYRQLGHRIDVAAESISRTIVASPPPLSTTHLTALTAKAEIVAPPVAEEANPGITFRIQGIVSDGKASLVMTTHGVAGLGETVDGFKVLAMQDDAVTFADRDGHPIKVPLYKEEPTP